jgi:hypothetical protein
MRLFPNNWRSSAACWRFRAAPTCTQILAHLLTSSVGTGTGYSACTLLLWGGLGVLRSQFQAVPIPQGLSPSTERPGNVCTAPGLAGPPYSKPALSTPSAQRQHCVVVSAVWPPGGCLLNQGQGQFASFGQVGPWKTYLLKILPDKRVLW